MHASIRQLIEEKGHTVFHTRPDATVREAVQQMNENHIGALLVMRDDQPVGMFTERDVLVRIVAAGLDPNATPVGAVMSTRLTVIGLDATVDEALRVITEQRHRHLPVVDASNRVIGLISIGDLTRWTVRNDESYIENLNRYIWGATPD